MIASIHKTWRAALFGKVGVIDGTAAQESGLTRSDFLRVVATGFLSAGLGMTAGRAIAASPASTAPVTDLNTFYDAWQERFNAADIEGMVDLYVSDVTYINPDGKELIGSSGVRTDFLGLFELKPKIDIHDRRHVVYQDTALTTNHWKLELTNPDGAKQELTGGGIEIVRKQADGGWRYIIDDASRSAS